MFLPNGEENPEVTTRDINIYVTDAKRNEPLSGCTVSIGDISSVTGSAGGCTLRGISDGEHEIIVTYESSVIWTESITVDSEHTSFILAI